MVGFCFLSLETLQTPLSRLSLSAITLHAPEPPRDGHRHRTAPHWTRRTAHPDPHGTGRGTHRPPSFATGRRHAGDTQTQLRYARFVCVCDTKRSPARTSAVRTCMRGKYMGAGRAHRVCERSHRTGPRGQATAAAKLSSFWRSAWPAAMAARPDVCSLCSACAARRSCASRSLAARVVVRSLLQCDANIQG